MKDTIKRGFAWTIGVCLAYATVGVAKDSIMRWASKDEKFMEWEKEHDPELYEKLKKYV